MLVLASLAGLALPAPSADATRASAEVLRYRIVRRTPRFIVAQRRGVRVVVRRGRAHLVGNKNTQFRVKRRTQGSVFLAKVNERKPATPIPTSTPAVTPMPGPTPTPPPNSTPTPNTMPSASPAATPSPTPTATSTPAPMPTAPSPGWREVFADDFTGRALDLDNWFTYDGQPAGDPGGWFDTTHVALSDGNLVISGYQDPADGGRWVTGGVCSKPALVQTYGKYLVRFRFDAGAGIAHAILLWPANNSWPPEIDFSEDNGADRQTTYATLHYGSSDTQMQHQTSVDLTQWHTLGVEWTSGRIAYTLDGAVWATVTGASVPAVPMVLDIQTQAWSSGTSTWERGTDSTTPAHVNLYVDWVVAYAPGS